MKTTLFVYGTLMQGQYNHSLLGSSEYLGKASLSGYQMYDLGSYPAIIPGNGTVLGELYSISEETLRTVDHLEGNGSLYSRVPCTVITERGKTLTAVCYEYLRSVDDCPTVPSPRPYDELVWYVAYGSNMLEERFRYYIQGGSCPANGKHYAGCKNKTFPKVSIPCSLDFELYFGNHSPSWDYGGVAFLDKDCPGNTPGRAWLITREQFFEIQQQECNSREWYDEVLPLPGIQGYPAYTFTNHRRRTENAPSPAYRDIIRRGLAETELLSEESRSK